ncbi:DUF4334 domain-containing protein [Rhizobium cauense]|uniref:DUF4334 domain-containing protein n=1 Tax=Rhizobium cauense TaxID=1166683 RepID=UPI0021D44E14|nr:DUF4334 domain-containing protein [Rhizobium cauense]
MNEVGITSSQPPPLFRSQNEALSFFDELQPVVPAEMIGLWQGHGIATGHPLDGVLENLGWYGKRVHPDLRADALLFRAGPGRLAAVDPALIPLELALWLSRFGRTRIARNWFTYLQRAVRARAPVSRLKPLPFRGKTSTAMIYDRQPIIDHFRRIDDEMVIGAMVVEGDGRFFFFLLRRASPAPARA